MRILVAFFLVLSFSFSTFAQAPDTTALTKVGQLVPAFTVKTLDGKTVNIADLRGKVVLINFFATWCGPCMAEMPHVEKELWQQFKSDGLVVLAIGREHTAEELVKFNKEKGFTFPIAPDPKREVYSRFARQYIPRNYVIGKDGRIAFQSMGYTSEDFKAMTEFIQSCVRERLKP